MTQAENGKSFGDTKAGRFAQAVFEKMFAAVGRTFSPEILATPDWFLSSAWTGEQQDAFRRWMASAGMKTMHWGRKAATREASLFLLFYGWTISPAKERVARLSARKLKVRRPRKMR